MLKNYKKAMGWPSLIISITYVQSVLPYLLKYFT